ncbi:MAG: AraC family transcriptional regulator [Victivallales bacterium]|nr:AraC family transcriptional regulator [Victivallales bacterium]
MTKKQQGTVRHLRLRRYAKEDFLSAMNVVHLMDDASEDGFSRTLPHTHDCYELVVVLRGAGTHHINQQELPIRPGNIYLLCPKECHYYRYTEPLSLLTFMFNAKIIRPLRSRLAELPGFSRLFLLDGHAVHEELSVAPGVVAEINLLLNTLDMDSHSDEPGRELSQMLNLTKVLLLILQNEQGGSASARNTMDIGCAVSYMLKNFHQEITLERLARMTNSSVSTFSRKFQREFQMSPMQWLMKLRITKSMNLLMCSDMRIKEVATAVGFPNSLYFSRQFRKAIGCTPKAYRRNVHGPLEVIQGERILRGIKDLEY